MKIQSSGNPMDGTAKMLVELNQEEIAIVSSALVAFTMASTPALLGTAMLNIAFNMDDKSIDSFFDDEKIKRINPQFSNMREFYHHRNLLMRNAAAEQERKKDSNEIDSSNETNQGPTT